MRVLFLLLTKLLAIVLVHGQDTSITLPADGEWIDIGTQTVYFIERHKAANWSKAWDICASKAPGGTLAKFETKDTMLRLRSYLKGIRGYLWIGLHFYRQGPFIWTDNSTPAFTNWKKGEVKGTFFKEYVELDAETMDWRSSPYCYLDRLYICSFDKGAERITTSNETAYHIEKHLKISWSEAASICSSWEYLGRQGRLVNFDTKEEMHLLRSHLKYILGFFWIGLRSYWRDSGVFAWTDDIPRNFTNWEEGEPNIRILKDCVGLNARTMAWNSQPCNSKQLFICAFHKSTKPSLVKGFPSGVQVAEVSVGIVISLVILCILVFIFG